MQGGLQKRGYSAGGTGLPAYVTSLKSLGQFIGAAGIRRTTPISKHSPGGQVSQIFIQACTEAWEDLLIIFTRWVARGREDSWSHLGRVLDG